MKLDHRTDIYSLGAVLYELLTHRRPFPGESREEILGGILTKDPRPPRRFNPRIPLDLETICQKAMEKDPDRRYQNAGEFASDLRQYLQHGLISAKRAGLPRRMWKSIRRHPTAATATGLLFLFAVVVAGVVWVQGHRYDAAEVERLLLEAELAWGAGMYEENLALAEQALAIAPQNPSARLQQAKALIHLDRSREAVLDARGRLDSSRDDWIAHLILAMAATSDKNPDLSIDPTEHTRVLERLAPESSEAYFARAQIASGPSAKLKLLDRALEIDPLNAVALKARINLLISMRDSKAALLDCDRLIASRPHSPQGYRMKSAALRVMRRYEAAYEAIQRAIDMTDVDEQPFDAMWNFWTRAYIHAERRESQKQISDYDRAIDAGPRFTQAIVNRAMAYTSIGEYDKALEDALRAIEINPDFLEGHTRLFQVYRATEQTDRLRLAMDALLERVDMWRDQRTRAKAYSHLSGWYRQLGDNQGALALAERAIALDPDLELGYWVRLITRQQLGDEKGVEEDCDHLESMTIENLDADLNRAWALANTCRRLEKAIESYTRIIERAPHWADPRYRRGTMHYRMSDFESALSDLGMAIELAPQWREPYLARAVILQQRDEHADALIDYARAKDLAPTDPTTLNAYAWALLVSEPIELQDPAKALELSLQANELAGFSNPNHLDALAMAYHKNGKYEAAIETQKKALSLLPEGANRDQFEKHLAEFEAALREEQ
jgi:tetratricopeptide (TPR) repeat protein